MICSHVEVAADRVSDVAATDGKPVAVATGDKHEQIGVGQLDALREGSARPWTELKPYAVV